MKNEVASGNYNGKTYIWDVESKTLKFDLGNLTRATKSISYDNHKGNILATANGNSINLWQIKNDKLITQFSHKSTVSCVAINPHYHKEIASAHYDGSINFWKLDRKQH